MSYYNYQNKQDAFQAAQQGVKQAADAYADLDPQRSDYGHQLNNVMQEVNEAIQQIQKASAFASEHQRSQLAQYLDNIQIILAGINETES